MYVGLSSCPTHSSGNVGDQLITESIIKLIKEQKRDIEIETYYRREDLTSRLDHINKARGIILFGCPIINDIIPNAYRFAENLDWIKPPIIPFSAAFKFFPADIDLLKYKSLNKITRDFINKIIKNCPNNEFPVRTKWVGKFLELQGFKTTLTGDPAWYDPEYIGKSFHRPNEINQLVFTPPHNKLYLDQGKKLLKKLSEKYPDTKKIISFQSALKHTDRDIREVGRNYGWNIKYTSHNTDNIEFYRKSDLHIGYRKHGHLAHLRWRRPSIVLAEDSRSMGLNETFGTAGFPAFELKFSAKNTHYIQEFSKLKAIKGLEFILSKSSISEKLPVKENKTAKAKPNVIPNIFEFLRKQNGNNWKAYDIIQKKIDDTYHKQMKPYIRGILSV